MAAKKFTPAMRGALVERFAAGCTITDAASAAGVRENTLKSWLQKGRAESEGDYAEFAQSVEVARKEARERPEPMTEAEHRLIVSEAARRGNTQAMKLYWEILQADHEPEELEEPADPLSELDELAEVRARRAA